MAYNPDANLENIFKFDEFESLFKTDLGIDMSPDLVVLKNRLLKADDRPSTRLTAMSAPTLIVLPFRTLSDNPEHRYFSEGLTEDVIAQLSKFSTRAVVARQSDLGATQPGGPLSQAEAFGAD